jgi:hypothetical protein
MENGYGSPLYKERSNGTSAAQSPQAAQEIMRKLSQVSVRLGAREPVRPAVCNYSQIGLAPGMAIVDFAFIEPAVLASLHHLANDGGELPSTVDGMMSARVAVGFDVLVNLHAQLGAVIEHLGASEEGRPVPGI